MTPEEYERFKNAEKEHLRKLKELKQAVRVLERQKRIQSSLQDINQSSERALEAQRETVDRLAMETARQEARLELALDSASEGSDDLAPEEQDEALRRARARALVQKMKEATDSSVEDADARSPRRIRPSGRSPDLERGTEETENPTADRKERPDKTIGRM